MARTSVLLCVTLLATVVAGHSEADCRPLVVTRDGLVRGVQARSAGGKLFYSFKGIPYAQPPLGHLRFQSPRRHIGWRGVLDASEHGSRCTQFDLFNNSTRVGTEDCLFVNVYSRQLPGLGLLTGGLPVMVYIHGGAFFFGSGDSDFHGPHYFMNEDVVLVTFNYRLGPFGFFTTHNSNAPGNYGLLDQVMLLQWVQDNIAAFGGDPKLVTIFGKSDGGISVSLLVLSPLAKGLFHHAISQSGTSLFRLSGKRESARMLARQLQCSSDRTEVMVDCIRNVSAVALLDAMMELRAHNKASFIPRIDREAETPFLPQDPRFLLETGKFNLVPWLSGMTEMEGSVLLPLVFPNEQSIEGVLEGNITLWRKLTGLVDDTETSIVDCGADAIEETIKVRNFFVGNDGISLEAVVRILSDRLVNPISEEIRLASAHAPLYKYVLDHRGPGRQTIAEHIEWPVPENIRWPLPEHGVSHLDGLLYLFSRENRPLARPGSPAYTMIRFKVNLWTNFARTGRPSSDVLPMPDWPIFTEQSQRHMRLNSEPSLGERLFEERVHFWQTVRINEPWRHRVQTSCEEYNHSRDGEHGNSLAGEYGSSIGESL